MERKWQRNITIMVDVIRQAPINVFYYPHSTHIFHVPTLPIPTHTFHVSTHTFHVSTLHIPTHIFHIPTHIFHVHTYLYATIC